MHDALNLLSDRAPAWVRQQVPPERYTRDGLRLTRRACRRMPVNVRRVPVTLERMAINSWRGVSRPESPPGVCPPEPRRRSTTPCPSGRDDLSTRRQHHRSTASGPRGPPGCAPTARNTRLKVQYALTGRGGEQPPRRGVRRCDLRRVDTCGLARTQLQLFFKATAMNVVRVIAWLRGEPLGERRRKPGHFRRPGAPSVVTPGGAPLRELT